jgi:ketosteroid isomerase-like protein
MLEHYKQHQHDKRMIILLKKFAMRITMSLVFFTLVFFISEAQTPATKEDSANAEIKQLTLVWYTAIKNRDSATIERILAPDYTVDGSWPRSNWINNILHHFKIDSFEVAAEPKISNYGDAILSEGLLYWKGTRDDKPFMNAEFYVTDLWVYRNNRWQILMRLLKFSKNR